MPRSGIQTPFNGVLASNVTPALPSPSDAVDERSDEGFRNWFKLVLLFPDNKTC